MLLWLICQWPVLLSSSPWTQLAASVAQPLVEPIMGLHQCLPEGTGIRVCITLKPGLARKEEPAICCLYCTARLDHVSCAGRPLPVPPGCMERLRVEPLCHGGGLHD